MIKYTWKQQSHQQSLIYTLYWEKGHSTLSYSNVTLGLTCLEACQNRPSSSSHRLLEIQTWQMQRDRWHCFFKFILSLHTSANAGTRHWLLQFSPDTWSCIHLLRTLLTERSTSFKEMVLQRHPEDGENQGTNVSIGRNLWRVPGASHVVQRVS